MAETTFMVAEGYDGDRLDHALAQAFPGFGLRLRRRCWERGRVLVDGRERAASYRVRAGQMVAVVENASEDGAEEVWALPEIAAERSDYAAVNKPAGLHSAAIAGKPGPSVEAMLEELFPGRDARLVNRLDRPTSGLLVVAFGPEAATRYQRWEAAGLIRKTYRAVVHGFLEYDFTIRRMLDTGNRRKTRVLPSDGDDPLRWTVVSSEEYRKENDTTLVEAVIQRGARHQIRAHLAAIGHPIVGDDLYGLEDTSAELLHLHHHHVEFPDFSASVPPPWGE